MLTDREVLDEEFVPQRELVVHRREKLDRLLDTLRPTEFGPSDLTYLLGPTGTGKTMLARLALDLLADDESMPHHDSVYVNSWQHYERTDILYQIVDAFEPALPKLKATSRSQLIDTLNSSDHPRYVILDEADQLADTAVLYDLAEISDLYLILIANHEDDLFADMDPRLQSRLTIGQRIECDRYETDELAAILQKRAEYVLGPEGKYYTRQVLEYIAHHAEGDARTAIRTLRVAVENRDGEITRADVDEALPQARTQLRQRSLDQLNDHQQAVYEIVQEAGPLAPDDIYDRYKARVESPRTERTVRKYLRKLRQYNLVEDEGRSVDRQYSPIE